MRIAFVILAASALLVIAILSESDDSAGRTGLSAPTDMGDTEPRPSVDYPVEHGLAPGDTLSPWILYLAFGTALAVYFVLAPTRASKARE